MKRLLILAYDFPPYVSVGGLRPYAWYKYLKEFGIYPIVVTRQWGNKYGNELDYVAPSATNETIIEETEYGTIIRTPYKPNLANKILLRFGPNRFSLIRRLVSAYFEIMQCFFNVGPKSGLYKGAKQYLMQNKVDAIIATGEPFVLFKYASLLAKKHNIPWIADYRDPWTQTASRNAFFFTKQLNVFCEKRFLSSACCATTVSEHFAKLISENVKSNFHVVSNGFDDDSFAKVRNIAQSSDKLRMAYVGTIYKYHPVESLFNVLNSMVLKGTLVNFELNFFGVRDFIGIKNLLNDRFPALKPLVNIYPSMPNNQLMEQLAKHNVLLLFNYYSIVGTKIYDYLALNRRIILCYKNDFEALNLKEQYFGAADDASRPQEELIHKTNAGVVVENSQHLLQVMTNLVAEFKESGAIRCETQNAENYSRRGQTKLLSDIIDKKLE